MDRSRLNRFLSQQLDELQLEKPVFVAPTDPVRKALSLMHEGSRSCVLATEAGSLTGIFTERDVLTRCMEEGFNWEQPLDQAVLTRQPRTVSAKATVADAIATMRQHHYRTLPVEGHDGRIIGLVRIGDLLTHLAEAFPEDVLNLPPRPHQVMEKPEGG